METILVALAFVGVLAGLVLVGMMGTLYFYIHGALGFSPIRGASGLRALTARSVPFQVSEEARQTEINLGLSADSGTRYVRGSMLVTGFVLLLFFVGVIAVLSATIH